MCVGVNARDLVSFFYCLCFEDVQFIDHIYYQLLTYYMKKIQYEVNLGLRHYIELSSC